MGIPRARLLLPLCFVQLHCASVSPDIDAELARSFPPGTPHHVAAPEGRQRLRTVRFVEGERRDELGRMLVERLGAAGAPAVGYDAYPLEKTLGSGYARQVVDYCDLVAFDAEGRILGAIRSKGSC